jgi:hypothetical protein
MSGYKRFLGGSWHISRRCIALNEGGYVCGLTWLRKSGFLDVWFKLPIRSARSHRFTRWER